MAITPLVGTLAYILDNQTDQVLLIRRNSRLDDDHFGKVNGLGGKVERNEHVLSGIDKFLKKQELECSVKNLEESLSD